MRKSTNSSLKALIEHFCEREDLASYDPYDIWKTGVGFRVKKLYNRCRVLGLPLAALLALFDDLMNHRLRWFYRPIEHPIARAMAAMCLLNLYRSRRDPALLQAAGRHLDWLLSNTCPGFSGYCWGLGFPHAVSRDVIYNCSTPFSTITPYALEALVQAATVFGNGRFLREIGSIYQFFEQDIQVMEQDDHSMATSYGPYRDRIVTNAVSYAMYSYCLLLPYLPAVQQQHAADKARKLYMYVRRQQRGDGSWFYSPYGRSFVDCFHSCIILKNIIKSDRVLKLEGSASMVAAGYAYLVASFLDPRLFLFKRFAVRNKIGLVRFDLYDNAEALNLALLLGKGDMAERLLASILRNFCEGPDIYSQIDFIGCRKNKNTLRWAVMPFLYAVSQMVGADN